MIKLSVREIIDESLVNKFWRELPYDFCRDMAFSICRYHGEDWELYKVWNDLEPKERLEKIQSYLSKDKQNV